MRSEASFDQCYACSDELRISNRQPTLFIMEGSVIYVLVVEDFAPFREFICSTRGQTPSQPDSTDFGRKAQPNDDRLGELFLSGSGRPSLRCGRSSRPPKAASLAQRQHP